MAWARLPLAVLVVSFTPFLAHAAPLPTRHARLSQPGGSLTQRISNGRLVHDPNPKRHASVRHGIEVLKLSHSTPSSTPPSPPPDPATVAAEKHLLAVINRDRAGHRAPALVLDAQQSRCSYQHSVHMAKVGYISHDQFPQDVCVSPTEAGENVGAAPGDAMSASIELQQLMMAEGPCPKKTCTAVQFHAHGHYLNIMKASYKRIGIGIYVHGGVTWLTEDFIG